jgi:hypothetical protein
MGIFSSLLSLPVTAPLSGVAWVAAKLTEAAEAQFYNPEVIKNTLAGLEEQLVAGLITEDQYEEQEMVLLLRLKEARLSGK